MKVVFDQHPAFYSLLNLELGTEHQPQTSFLITLLDDTGFVVAVTALSDWGEHNVELTLATDGSKRWASKRYIRAVFDFCFADAARTRVTTIVNRRDVTWGLMQTRLGFVREAYLTDWFGPGLDGTLYCMTRVAYNRARWVAKGRNYEKAETAPGS